MCILALPPDSVTRVASSSWTAADWSQAITAGATLVYTIGTFMLWGITRKSLKISKEQIAASDRRQRNAAWSQLLSSHRELYSLILQNQAWSRSLEESLGETAVSLRQRMVGNWVINHQSQVFSHYLDGDIDQDVWQAVKLDMQEVFRWRFVQERWAKVRMLHPPAFRDFVEGELMKSLSSTARQPGKLEGMMERGRLTLLSGDACGDASCPAIYQTENGSILVQGGRVSAELRSSLTVPDSEDLVEIPIDVLRAAGARLARDV